MSNADKRNALHVLRRELRKIHFPHDPDYERYCYLGQKLGILVIYIIQNVLHHPKLKNAFHCLSFIKIQPIFVYSICCLPISS